MGAHGRCRCGSVIVGNGIKNRLMLCDNARVDTLKPGPLLGIVKTPLDQGSVKRFGDRVLLRCHHAMMKGLVCVAKLFGLSFGGTTGLQSFCQCFDIILIMHASSFHGSIGFKHDAQIVKLRPSGGIGQHRLHHIANRFHRAPWCRFKHDGRNAGQGQGAASILIGFAANKAFETGQPVRIADLCPQLGDIKRLGELP